MKKLHKKHYSGDDITPLCDTPDGIFPAKCVDSVKLVTCKKCLKIIKKQEGKS
jgi:hypothetical protein